MIRTLKVSEHPRAPTNDVYVSGQVVTVLRFDQDVNPAKTKFAGGWEGRFAPLLVGSKKVVIDPLRDLGLEERVPLLVTLVDGTELPFLVRPPLGARDGGWEGWTDHQINVFKDPDSFNAVVSSLRDSLTRERALSAKVEQFKKEENSVDHAYATLLANGEAKATPFHRAAYYHPKTEDMDVIVEVFSGPGKAAAVITLTNTGYGGPWTFERAYLTRDLSPSTARPFALRMDRSTIVPGQTGRIAVVADKSAFEMREGQLVDLALQIFRGDGHLQLAVSLEHTLIQK